MSCFGWTAIEIERPAGNMKRGTAKEMDSASERSMCHPNAGDVCLCKTVVEVAVVGITFTCHGSGFAIEYSTRPTKTQKRMLLLASGV